MVLRDLTSKAAERIKSVFSKDNRFFYGSAEGRQEAWQEEAQPAHTQGVYPQAYAQPQYAAQAQQGYAQQPVYSQNPYQQGAPAQYQQPQPAAQPYQQPYQQPWQTPQHQEAQPQAMHQQTAPYLSPQQAQLNTQQEASGRNRRAAQHVQQQQPDSNLVQFPGTQAEQETPQMDAYVVNVTSIAGCRQAMTCLRKGNCTLVVMDQLIDKAEVRRYVDMLNGACFALGGTMTRLSTRVGFYILAPSGMMVYTDPVTASANAPQAATRPAPQPQPSGQPHAPYQAAPVYPQQAYYPQQPQQAAPQYEQGFQQQPGPYAPPMAGPGMAYTPDPYQAQPYAQ